jgi:nucleoside-diphosphate-sugar epimerase
MKVFITGIGSFVGNLLCLHLRAGCHSVVGSMRNPKPGSGVHRLVLGEACDAEVFRDHDVVIHAAWDLESKDVSFNVEATRQIVDAARRVGVKRQVFLSSLSASPSAPTIYGKSKYLAEQLFDYEKGDLVIRPGLVVGPGGLFQRTFELVRRSPVVPLIGAGKLRILLVGQSQLAEAITHLLTTTFGFRRPCLLFHPIIPTQAELIRAICTKKNWRRFILPVPAGVLLWGLTLAEKFSVRLPIKSANLRAALKNDGVSEASDLIPILGLAEPYPKILSLLDPLE